MNERRQAHAPYFPGRVESWKGLRRDYRSAWTLAAGDADHAHPLRGEEEGSGVFDHLRGVEEEAAAEVTSPTNYRG